jgi:hypothetical protein
MENQIELDIPFGPSQGEITSHNGEWRILSLNPPVVSLIFIIHPTRVYISYVYFLIR